MQIQKLDKFSGINFCNNHNAYYYNAAFYFLLMNIPYTVQFQAIKKSAFPEFI